MGVRWVHGDVRLHLTSPPAAVVRSVFIDPSLPAPRPHPSLVPLLLRECFLTAHLVYQAPRRGRVGHLRTMAGDALVGTRGRPFRGLGGRRARWWGQWMTGTKANTHGPVGTQKSGSQLGQHRDPLPLPAPPMFPCWLLSPPRAVWGPPQAGTATDRASRGRGKRAHCPRSVRAQERTRTQTVMGLQDGPWPRPTSVARRDGRCV